MCRRISPSARARTLLLSLPPHPRCPPLAASITRSVSGHDAALERERRGSGRRRRSDHEQQVTVVDPSVSLCGGYSYDSTSIRRAFDCLSESVCHSVAYIGPKSRTERPRETKIGTEVAHVTRDSDTTFKVKRSKVNLQWAGAYCGGLLHSLFITLRCRVL